MQDSGTQTEEPVENSAEIHGPPTDCESSPPTESSLISAPPTAPESPQITAPPTAPESPQITAPPTAPESPQITGPSTARESPTPTGAPIIFGSPSIPRAYTISHLPVLPNFPVRLELSQLPEFYPAPQLPTQLTSLEGSENPEARNVREPPNLQQSREVVKVARNAACPELSSADIPSTAEEESFDFVKWRLHAQLECLLCVEIMVPPIMVCKNGHMICHNCRPKLDRCPLCRDNITSKRNIFAEEVSKLLKVPCKYAKQGCRVYQQPDKIQEHDVLCQYQPVDCLAGYGRQYVTKCGWNGKKFELLGHVSEKHGLTMIHAKQPIMYTTPWIHEVDYTQVTLVCAHGDVFWLTLKFDVKARKRFETVQYIGSAVSARRFRYRCDLLSTDEKTGVSFFSAVTSTLEDAENVFTFEPHFQMDIDVFKRDFADRDGHVPGYKLTIDDV